MQPETLLVARKVVTIFGPLALGGSHRDFNQGPQLQLALGPHTPQLALDTMNELGADLHLMTGIMSHPTLIWVEQSLNNLRLRYCKQITEGQLSINN